MEESKTLGLRSRSYEHRQRYGMAGKGSQTEAMLGGCHTVEGRQERE